MEHWLKWVNTSFFFHSRLGEKLCLMYDLDEAEEGGISVNIVPLILAGVQADGDSSSRYFISSIFAQLFLLNYFVHIFGPGLRQMPCTSYKRQIFTFCCKIRTRSNKTFWVLLVNLYNKLELGRFCQPEHQPFRYERSKLLSTDK